jgi:ABC-2 type transport system ATP-binding protein
VILASSPGATPGSSAGMSATRRYGRSVPAIEVADLVVRYGTFVAVDGVDLTVAAGEVVTVLGPNGAGKTSTVEVLEGYRRPAGGRVRVLGLDPQADHRALTARIGVMLQRGGVYPTMTPAEAVPLFAAYYPEPEEPTALLRRVGLDDAARTPWRRLSGGQQQRLSLALALVGRPDVVFLDEPTAGVDPEGRLAIRSVIGELRERGVAVLVTTHELEEAERMADRVVIVDHGRVVADGTPAALRRAGGAGAAIRFGAPAGIDVVALAAAVAAPVTEERPGEYTVAAPAENHPATIAALTAWLAARDLPLADLQAGRQRLEEVYLRLTGAGRADGADRTTGGHAT